MPADTSNGEAIYSEVRAFLKRQPDVIVSYKTIKTLWNQTLSLSGNHLIYARKSGQGVFIPMLVFYKYFKSYSKRYTIIQKNNNGLFMKPSNL